MAHLLSTNNGKVEMFSGNNIVPWHGLGEVVAGQLTAKEALKTAHLDWEVKREPIYTHFGNVPTQVEGYASITRQDNGKSLGVVGSRYTVIQNEVAFDFFDEVVGSGQAVYETAGALADGKRIWIMARIPGHLFIDSRPDDKLDKMVLLMNSHDGSRALMMQHVTTRVVCQNTLSAALSGATNQISIRHTKNFEGKVNEAQRILKVIHGYYDNLQAVINTLAAQEMNQDGMVKFTEKLVPAVLEPGEDLPTRTLNIRNEINMLFTRGTGNLGKSRWDALNAVTEYVDHNRSTRGDNEQESRFSSSVLGSGNQMKNRALEILTA